MNFKPTLWKLIASIASGILVNYFLAGRVTVFCDCVINTPCNCPSGWMDFAFEPMIMVVSLSTTVIIYAVWSFIQKK